MCFTPLYFNLGVDIHICFYMISSLWNLLGLPFNIRFKEILPTWGDGVHPSSDPWGDPFGEGYEPKRAALAGSPIAGGWKFVLAGFQGDADFIAALFSLNRCSTNSTTPKKTIWFLVFFFLVGQWFFCNHQWKLRKLPSQRVLLSLQGHCISKSWQPSWWPSRSVFPLGPRCKLSATAAWLQGASA